MGERGEQLTHAPIRSCKRPAGKRTEASGEASRTLLALRSTRADRGARTGLLQQQVLVGLTCSGKDEFVESCAIRHQHVGVSQPSGSGASLAGAGH